ncbi:MAG: adenylosuccinate lyase [Bacilli bacterium]
MESNNYSSYVSPLSTRYASPEMQYLFSEEYKFKTFRRLWVYLAEAEKELGLDITQDQIDELKKNQDNLNLDVAHEREKIVKHDVMAHIYAYGLQCPKAKGIIHLGATSCYVDDNTDMIIMKEASKLILTKIAQVLVNLKKFALKYKDLPCLSYTHLQPAQMTTIGRRATLWMNELVIDTKNIQYQLDNLQPLGCKGTTGTQASFMDLFKGNEKKVKKLDELIVKKMGFKSPIMVSGQTYTRKEDSYLLNCLAGVASSAYKFSNDLRILQSFKEMEEPFEKDQVGSSAMPYKRNPMRAERMSGLSRYIILNSLNSDFTAGTQFLERTLDDSANRRLTISECFLGVDALLSVYINITDGLVVNKKIIEQRVKENLPFMATENIMMEAVKKGKDRQQIHELLREYSQASGDDMKNGKPNTLLDKISNDPQFGLTKEEIAAIIDPIKFTGRSSSQTKEFISAEVDPLIRKYHKKEIQEKLNV